MSLNVYKSGLLPHYSLRHLYVSSINNITSVPRIVIAQCPQLLAPVKKIYSVDVGHRYRNLQRDNF